MGKLMKALRILKQVADCAINMRVCYKYLYASLYGISCLCYNFYTICYLSICVRILRVYCGSSIMLKFEEIFCMYESYFVFLCFFLVVF